MVNRAVTRRPSATHAAAIPACTNRRIEPIEIRRERPGLTDASRSELINSWTRLRLTPSIAALSRSVNNIRSMIIFPSVGHRWSLVGVSASPTGDGVVSAWPSWASLRSVRRTASLRPLIRKGASRELPTFGQLSVRKELNVIPPGRPAAATGPSR